MAEESRNGAAAYVPQPGDFEFLSGRDIATDKNFASMSYWKGVAIHFFRDRKAVAGLIIIVAIILLSAFGPMVNSYGYRDIVSFRNEKNRKESPRGFRRFMK